MKILAVETSGKTFSVALLEDTFVKAASYYNCGHIHSEMLIPAIEKILIDTKTTYKDIDKFAVSTGPGSFTGIRVGMTAVKTLAQILNKPVVAIDTLTILEKSITAAGNIIAVPVIDALRNEVYVKKGKIIAIESVDKFIKENKNNKNKIMLIGNGALVYKDLFLKHLGKTSVILPEINHMPKASVLGSMACNIKGENFMKIKPLYIRKSWAEESKK